MRVSVLAKNLLLGLLSVSLFSLSQATAAPSIDTLDIQGYMRKADGSTVTNGNYDLVFGVFQNGTAIWAKQYSNVSITSGVFSQMLTGAGSALETLPATTGMNADYSGVTLNPLLLQSSGNGAVLIRIYASGAIDGNHPQFDVTLNSVPSSFSAAFAQSVGSGAVSFSSLASGVYTQTSSASKLVQLNPSGKLDPSLYGSDIPASRISGVLAPAQFSITASDLPIVPVSKGGTGISGLGGANQLLAINANGNGAEYKSILAGANVNVAHAAGTITISAANSSSGTVTSVVAGNGLTGGTITAAGTLAVNAGTGANQIVQLDSSSRLPAVNGSQITSLNATNMTTGTISSAVLPVAGASSSGVVTATAQTIAGDKTFSGTMTVGGTTVYTTSTVASGGSSPYDGSTVAKVFPVSKTITFLTGTAATTISCLSAGVAGQMIYIVATGAIGTGLTISNNTNCVNGTRIYTNTNANVRSSTNSSRASAQFIYTGTEWILISTIL